MNRYTKCVHVVAFPDYRPKMCEVTLPNLRAYARRIGADFNLINKSRFAGFPPNFERLQVWWDGAGYDFNLNIDADTLLHAEAEDPTEWFPLDHFGSLWGMDAEYYFNIQDKYFIRDGRNQAISDNFTVSTLLSHDVWEPPTLDWNFDLMRSRCLRDPRQVSEYWLSRNLAKYGIKHTGAMKDHSKVFGLMATTHKGQLSDEDCADIMRKQLASWGME